MDREIRCDFYFGDRVDTPIKLMAFEKLNGFKKILRNVYIIDGKFVWQKGAWKLVFKDYKYYLITGSANCLSNWMILILAILMNKKVYAWAHGMKGGGSKKWRVFERTFFSLCDKVLLYGNYSRQLMINEGLNKNKLLLIYNSLDYEKQLPIRKKLSPSSIYKDHFKNDLPTIIYIGRIQKYKKIDMILTCMKSLSAREIFCNLVIVGENVDHDSIVSFVDTLRLKDHVWFYGACYQEEKIAELIYNAQVCVSPGPVGLTAIHSLTYGTPVISNNNFKTQMPEFESIIPTVTGDFFEDGNAKDLEIKVTEWLYTSDAQRSKVRSSAFQLIDEKYNPLYQVKILKRLLL
jgi:glycosyltransferase involved in cell wall biosynthesis